MKEKNTQAVEIIFLNNRRTRDAFMSPLLQGAGEGENLPPGTQPTLSSTACVAFKLILRMALSPFPCTPDDSSEEPCRLQ